VFLASLASAQSNSSNPGPASSESIQRFHEIAPSIIKQANLKAGQAVVISGSTAYLPFMEDLAIQLAPLGVTTVLDVRTDRLEIARRLGPGERYGFVPPSALDKEMAKNTDLRFEFPNVSEPGALGSISPEQRRLVGASLVAWRKFPHARRVSIHIPIEGDTSETGLTFAELSRYRWNAMQADYSHIAQVGESLRLALASGKTVRVTSPEGTDITFSIAPKGISVDALPLVMNSGSTEPARSASIPGGSLSGIIIQSSANGKVRAAWDVCDITVHDESMEVNRGLVQNVHAGSDELCVQRTLNGQHLAGFVIGLNPALADFRSHSQNAIDLESEGLVSLFFGGNSDYGGTDYAPTVWFVLLPKASVTVDGRSVLRAGQLAPDVIAGQPLRKP
jgi:leucyl aminopeptidase (aminopeptidase T)